MASVFKNHEDLKCEIKDEPKFEEMQPENDLMNSEKIEVIPSIPFFDSQVSLAVKMHCSGSESDNESSINPINELKFISEEVAAAPIILERSQIPKIKCIKDEAIENLTKKYEATFGKPLTTKSLLKKINNMKTRLKRKMDLKKNENKTIKLLNWEKSLLSALEGYINPTIRGALQFGIHDEESSDKISYDNQTLQRSGSQKNINESCSSLTDVQPLPPPTKKFATDKYETDTTRIMTTEELQRLVLLQQYNASIVQQQYYEKKLEIMQRHEDSTSCCCKNLPKCV